ncbi:MAG: phytoene desaturase family protein [Solirubrobacteraceae bacterium]
MHDVIVIGAGHNGLTCGAYLARAGRRVLVLERRSIVGGMCTTEETVAEAPGFKMNPCAVDTALTNIPVSVVDELHLAKYGLRFITPDPWAAYISPDDASIGMWADRNRTQTEIARLSRRDAESFSKFCNMMTEAWWALMPYFQDHPTRPTFKTLGQVLYRAAKGRRSLRGAARVFMSSPEQVIEEHFERDEVKAVLANLAAWSMLPLQEDGSGGVLAMMCSYFSWAVKRPVGGSGEFTKALAACVRDHGGEVRVDAAVDEVLISSGRAYGVRLTSGEELRAGQVIGATDPVTLMKGMVASEHVPQQTQAELRAMGNLRWNITCLKADVALSKTPVLKCGRQELMQGYLLLGPTLEYVKQAQLESMNGDLPEAMAMGPMFPSLLDRSQVPAGSEGETIYLYMPAVPLELSGGRDWDDVKASYTDKVIAELDTYLPGLKDTVIGHWCQSPKDLSKKSTRGNVVHVDMSLSQMGPLRPTPSLSGYKTPIEGLWHTAAGAHPMGALQGWSGRTTARTVETRLRARKAPAAVAPPVAPLAYERPATEAAHSNGSAPMVSTPPAGGR